MSNLPSCILILLSLLFITTKHASASNDIRFVFNDGFPTSPGIGCSANETLLIDAVFGGRRRGLRVDRTSDNEMRDLATRSQHCTDVCRGIAVGSCWKTGCVGARELARSNDNERNLQSCTTQMEAINLQLDAVMQQVSFSCQQFLTNSTRRSECFPDVQYGTIDGVRVWAVTNSSQVVVIEKLLPNEQADFCRNTTLNIESLNQPCVLNATFQMIGPHNYTKFRSERKPPYAMFGDTGGRFERARLPHNGLYNISVTPAEDPTKTKTFTLNVMDCL